MTVGLVIVSHSARLAAGVAELAGQMSQGKTPIAAAGGTMNDVLGTSVDRIVAAIQSVDGPDGVLVLLDLGSAILSAEMALEMLSDDQRERVRLSFAPMVEGAVAAALEASLGRTLAQVQQVAEKTANVEQLQQLKPLTQAENAAVESLESPGNIAPVETSTLEVRLTLTNPTGLHARPASLFVQAAARFQANVRASGHGRETDATSIIGILSLGMRQGDTITIRASGLLLPRMKLVLRHLWSTFHSNKQPPGAVLRLRQGWLWVQLYSILRGPSPSMRWRSILSLQIRLIRSSGVCAKR